MDAVTAPAPESAAAPPVTAPARRRRGGTVWDMVRSLGILLIIVAVLVLVRGHDTGNPVHPVDPVPTYDGAAHVARFTLLVPTGLPASWRVTSARSDVPNPVGGTVQRGPVTLHVGFVTPGTRYAQLTESDRPGLDSVDDQLADGARPTGSVDVTGVAWQRWPSAKTGETVLVRQAAGVTYSVTGSATLTQLRQLAGSLAPYRER